MKKGQNSAQSITILLILLALFIVLYVLLLPPADREQLLNNNNQSTNTNSNSIDLETGGKILLYEIPGKLLLDSDNTIEHNMDSVDLFIKQEPEITQLSNSIKVERSAFGNQAETLTFNVANTENLKDVLLVFTVKEARGDLIIELNGEKIYQEAARKGQETVTIRNDLLVGKNELRFSVSNPGILFFINNHYSLTDVILKKELETINSKEDRTFYVSSNEKDKLRSSRLEFSSYCNSLDESATSLKVYLNSKILTSEVVSCGGGQRGVDIDNEDLLEGQNKLTFVIDSGSFQISDITVTNELTENIYKVYEFDLTRSEEEYVIDDTKRVVLRMVFDDKTSTKKGKILINEDQFSIDTTSDKYIKDISNAITDGINKVRIIPDREFEVNSLKITLEDRI